MQHIKECFSKHKVLKELKNRLSDRGERSEILNLLSKQQRGEVLSVTCSKKGYIVSLRSAYALHGVKQALRNFYLPVRVVVLPSGQ